MKIKEIAELTGYSMATVSRVLNDPQNVKDSTVEMIWDSIRSLQIERNYFFPDLYTNTTETNAILLPQNAGHATTLIEQSIAKFFPKSAQLKAFYFAAKNIDSQVNAINQITDQSFNVLCLQALDHPKIRLAIEQASKQGVKVMSFLSDINSQNIFAHVGLNNRMVGRTAGYLMAHSLKQEGCKIVVVSSGFAYRAHEDRVSGFVTSVKENSALKDFNIEIVHSQDRDDIIYHKTKQILKNNPSIAGIYNVGSGNQGLVKALRQSNRYRDIFYIAHNMSDFISHAMVDGLINITLHANYDDLVLNMLDKLLNRNIDFRLNKPFAYTNCQFDIKTKENY